MKTALTIAGSDSSGGAGIQADIKTMTANGVFALSAITALTAQNTTGVTGIFETTPEFLAQQLDAVFTDIYPDAIKIGMVSSSALIETIAKKLRQYDAKHIVVDPVMVATSGSKLLQDSAIQILTGQLLPMAEVVTPNIPEAEILSGMTITDAAGMEAAAKCISEKYGCAVLCKGGHKVNDADDLLWRNGSGKWFHGERIANPNTHGTGCTLSSAIASNLAKGYPLDAAVERAKAYISGCLSAMLDLGKGSGPHGPHVRPARRIRGALSHKKRAMISHTPQNRIPSPAASRIIPMGDGAFCVRFFQAKCTAHKTANTRIDLTSGANPSASVLMPPSVESIIFSAVARIMATTQGRTPERKASTPAYFIRFFSTAAISRMMKNEGSTTPIVAISAPGKPPCDEPIKVAILIASGPGVDSETATKLRNSASVSQP